MNIKEAKDEIIQTLKAYHKKDACGVYRYPMVRQRPILLMGPPGIGKTAIMEQIAGECGVGLVAYTMTHHTRQSAIGLPRIMEHDFQGQSYSVTEYTLSEIITSVYVCMEQTGCHEGILFLDEINCVSETLAPVMLQFLQNKQFGNHKVPEGWLIVAAGNPAVYNKSVREFDVVTLDRVRRIDVEADPECWLSYAINAGIHAAIYSYLKLRPDRFYSVRQEGEKKEFVTARGWEDLSQLLLSYEEDDLPVCEELIFQFLQDRSAAADFVAYYQVYRAYGADFCARELLAGTLSEEQQKLILERVSAGTLDIRFTFVSQLMDILGQHFRAYAQKEAYLREIKQEAGALISGQDKDVSQFEMQQLIDRKEERLKREIDNHLIDWEQERRIRHVLQFLRGVYVDGQKESSFRAAACEKIKRVEKELEQDADMIMSMLDRGFMLLEQLPENEGEILLFVSSVARMKTAAAFLIAHPNEAFLKYSGRLIVSDIPKS